MGKRESVPFPNGCKAKGGQARKRFMASDADVPFPIPSMSRSGSAKAAPISSCIATRKAITASRSAIFNGLRGWTTTTKIGECVLPAAHILFGKQGNSLVAHVDSAETLALAAVVDCADIKGIIPAMVKDTVSFMVSVSMHR